MTIVWYVALCSLVEFDQRFRAIYSLHQLLQLPLTSCQVQNLMSGALLPVQLHAFTVFTSILKTEAVCSYVLLTYS
jgi:hypothetical protein